MRMTWVNGWFVMGLYMEGHCVMMDTLFLLTVSATLPSIRKSSAATIEEAFPFSVERRWYNGLWRIRVLPNHDSNTMSTPPLQCVLELIL